MLNIFAVPTFDDPEKTRRARIFRNFMLGMMIFTTCMEITLTVFFQSDYIRSISNIIAFNTFCVLLIILNRKGFYKTASIIYIALSLIVSLIAVWFTGGMDSLTIPTLTIIVLMGGLMLGWKAAIITGLISASGSLVIAVSDLNNILPVNLVHYDPLMKWFMHSYILGILIFIQHFTISDLNKALQNIREELFLRKKVEEELRSSEELRKRVFDSSRVPIVVMDAVTYQYIDCNDAAVTIYRFKSREETLTKSPIDASAPCQYDGTDSTSMVKYYIEQAIAQGSITFEWLHQRPDGELWDGEVHLMSFKSGGRQLLQFTLQDITEKKRAEKALQESERRYRFIAENTDDVIWSLNLKTGKYTYVSPSVKKLRGYPPEEVMEQTLADTLTPESYQKALQTIEESVKNREPGDTTPRINITEYEEVHKDRSIIPTEISSTMFFNDKGEPSELIGVTRNITERKKAEEALRQSEERYRLISENTSDVIWTLELETGKFSYVSPSVEKLRGYTAKEVMEQTMAETLAPGSLEKALRMIEEVIQQQKPGDSTPQKRILELNELSRDGSIIHTEISATMIFNEQGKPLKIIGVTREITERKKAEEALRRSEERYKLVTELATDYVFILKIAANGKIIMDFISDNYYTITGRTPDEASNVDLWASFIHPEDTDLVFSTLHKLTTSPDTAEIECRSYIHGNQMRWISVIAKSQWDEKEKRVTSITGAVKDITERKEAEAALIESEYKARAILDTSFILLGILAPDGTVIDTNQTALDFAGVTLNDVLGKPFWETPWWSQSKKIQNQLKKGIQDAADGQAVHFETSHPDKDGSIHIIDFSLKPIKDETGRVTMLIPEGHDITERKKAEEAIQQSEAKYRSLFESASDAIFLMKDDRCVDCNPATLKIFNCEKKDILGKTPDQFHSPVQPDGRDSKQTSRKLISEAMNGTPLKFEWLHRRFDGTDFDSEVSLNKFLINDDPFLLAIVRDITERKKAEEALQQSEARYRSLFESSNDAIFLMKEGLTIDCNPAALTLFSAKRSAIINKSPYPYYPQFQPDGSNSIEKAVEITNKVLNGATLKFEWRYRKHDGTELDTEIILSKISVNNEPFMLAIVRDITERKKAEEQIKASLREKELLLRELYHRTKNNMQVISAMVNLSAGKLNDPDAVDIIREIDSKIHTMSLVHKKLYESRDLSHINLKEYLEELSSYLASFYRTLDDGLTIKVKGDDIYLLIDIAIPLGMVLNEMITNALKYAFPDKKNGCIEIQLVQNKEKDIQVTISDDGVGLPHGFSLAENASLGLNTVMAIIEQQLQGNIHFESEPGKGTTWLLTFKTDLYAKRI